ncbi:bis(5'-nucleosyl)-tetraphosphatase (symmetrical) YqeK [Paenibacillus vini]|uniref:Haloacid dehalogenase n=1 Tax=Paenibacillus vini TaxID=1476024 RepID=A0ABQ4MBD8_9BACL|nr:bis(5'-nucleosyl)-tetraphosphatase (symmetrical) YqeK [Paenibacillus vini]GIP53299.1 haloacid dehalogenase [Paenibacillus vini]
MHDIFKPITASIAFTGDLKTDIKSFLEVSNCLDTATHCIDVGTECRRIALMFNANPTKAELAGWLHDISAVFPNNVRLDVARQLELEVLPEETVFPMIIHQKISRVMAKEIFDITDQDVLDAVGCHTTLRSNSSLLDKVLFVADKISWDQKGTPPYLEDLNRNLQISLTHGAFAYINFLWEKRDTLKVIHPWLRDAYEELKDKVHLV